MVVIVEMGKPEQICRVLADRPLARRLSVEAHLL